MNKRLNLTREQEEAAAYRGGALLVSAAAGSGKTKVLVERLLRRIEEGDDINDFLVITYTRAAAAELRERVYDEIVRRIAENPSGKRLRRQSMLCRSASIDTIHGFCADILRENAHLAGLPHDFRIADENESDVIKAETLEKTLTAAYERHMGGKAGITEAEAAAFEDTAGPGLEDAAGPRLEDAAGPRLEDAAGPGLEDAAGPGLEDAAGPVKAAFCEADAAAACDAEAFKSLVDMTSPGRDDKKLGEIILATHAKMQSCPDPEAWAREQAANLELADVADVSETIWGAYLMERARPAVRFRYEEMIALREEIRLYPEPDAKYGPSIEATISDIGDFLEALGRGWDEARRHCRIDYSRIKPKPLSGFEELKSVRNQNKKAMDKLTEVFSYSSEEHLEDMRAVAPPLTALLRLISEFDLAYAQEKRRRSAVDFSDLEHLTLSLLTNPGTGERTGTAATISGRFKEILVDEYQDVNAVQEAIFNAVSRDGANVFMVGDARQSIYRFRLADPTIFMRKYERYRDAEEASSAGDAAKMILSRNFRTCPGVISFINYVFSSIMSAEFGEMDYTRREFLVHGREELPGERAADERMPGERAADERIPGEAHGRLPEAELDIIDMSEASDEDEEESPGAIQTEARFIARRVKELTSGGYMIPDGGVLRSARNSDIAILLRTIRGKAWQYEAALAEVGVDSETPGREGFFEAQEVQAALSLLAVVDNPMQDIPLAAALRGPVYGFSADELGEIRACSPHTDYYGALSVAAGIATPETRAKCAAFLSDIEELRAIAPDMPTDRFIRYVYNKTGLLGRVGPMRGGGVRRDNLIKLSEYAGAYERSGYKGLFSFLAYIRSLQERGAEFPAENNPAADAAGANAVRILSIHKSKGLEFPIVILADAAKKFNFKDTQAPIPVHNELGLGAQRIDGGKRVQYATIARIALQSKLASEMLAEELRVMYVGMTRAREKLIITATLKDAGREIGKLSGRLLAPCPTPPDDGEILSGPKIPPLICAEAKSMAEWIILPLLHGHQGGELLSRGEERACRRICDIRFIPPQGEEAPGEAPAAPAHATMPSAMRPIPAALTRPPHEEGNFRPEDVETLRGRFDYAYPHPKAPDLPSKLTVTGLKDRAPDAEAAVLDAAMPAPPRSGGIRPRFMDAGREAGAAEKGTALHLAMQHITFDKCVTFEGARGEIDRLVGKNLIRREQADLIDVARIVGFLGTQVGKRAIAANGVRREFRFSLLYPAESFYPGGGDDKILLQGVVDCFFEEDGEIVLIDFKTDRIAPGGITEKAARYTPQLAAYAHALERIVGKRVKERILYFFDAETAVTV